MNFARVALDVPVSTLFDYRAQDITSADIGRRVLVPFGSKIAVGVIIELARTTSLPPQRVRNVLNVLRDVPPVPDDVLALLKFCSDYYHYPYGESVLNALPTRLRRRQALNLAAPCRYRLTEAGRAIDHAAVPYRATIKHGLLRLLRTAADDGVDETVLRAIAPRAAAALKSMAEQGWVEQIAVAAPENRTHTPPPLVSGPRLTDEQRVALDVIRSTGQGFRPWLLHGVTGSGKTEVYFQIIADTIACGKQVLLLVPEINLTPQLEALIHARFPGTALVALHSGLNESERLVNWLTAQSGTAAIVLGTRLAVFTPLPNLGLIIVDEEHDVSFKQSDGLCYSARDLALVRAKYRSIPVVLGSATPALETFYKSLSGGYRVVKLTRRVNAMPPEVECIDTRRQSLIDGISQVLLNAVREMTRRGEQSLIFINRRGYAPVLICPSCSWTSDCHRCSAKLVLHLKDQRMRCHHCGHQEKVPLACPQCGNRDLAPLGQGTQRIESALARVFPDARILRIDRDSTRRKHAWNEMRRQIHAREVDILVGTQILAKGHDFPQLNLVGVINADSSLYSTDFRAAERLFARLTQVAGRAGRGTRRGRVLIQTQFPAHPLYQALQRDDYPAFAHALLAERKRAGFPPFVHQAVLRAEAPHMDTVLGFLRYAVGSGRGLADNVTIYDPVPAGMPRRAGIERAQLTVQSHSRTALQAFLRAWHARLAARAKRAVRWSLDVDPLEP
jgi:primosomal protein N' (replication factor Y)